MVIILSGLPPKNWAGQVEHLGQFSISKHLQSGSIFGQRQQAKANGVEPYTWLRRVLRDLPAAKTVDDVEALPPWNMRAMNDGGHGAPTGFVQ